MYTNNSQNLSYLTGSGGTVERLASPDLDGYVPLYDVLMPCRFESDARISAAMLLLL